MALIRFRPFPQVMDSSRDVMDIQTQMNRLFDNFFGQPSFRTDGARGYSSGGHVRDQG
jgi:hypothetical protein